MRLISTAIAIPSFTGRDVLFIDRSIDSDECDMQLIDNRTPLYDLINYKHRWRH